MSNQLNINEEGSTRMTRIIRGVLTFAQMATMSSAELKTAREDGWFPPMAGGDYGSDGPLRAKLKTIEAEIGKLVTTKAEQQKSLDEAKEAWAQSPDNDMNSDVFKAAEKARGDWGATEDKINDLTNVQIATLKMLGEGDKSGDNRDPNLRTKADEGERDGWNSKGLFTEDVATRLKAMASSSGHIGQIDLGQVASREATKADIAGTTGLRTAPSMGIKQDVYRPLRVLDLIPIGTMDNDALPYTQEGGTFGAAPVAEGVRKPEGGMTLTDAKADAETIAVFQKLRKQALADISALQSIVDQRLRYAVRLALEGQVIAGDGTSPNLSGIRDQSGIGKVAWADITDADATLADRILAGIVQVMLGQGVADGVAINPVEWQQILSAKDSTGAYLQGGPFSPIASTVWGVPMLPTVAMEAGFSLVGDYAMGAQVFVREGINVLLSDADGTDFTENKVTMLGEGRFALAVWRPVAFSEVDLAA